MRKVETRFYKNGCPAEPEIEEYSTVAEAREMVELTEHWGVDVISCRLLPKGA